METPKTVPVIVTRFNGPCIVVGIAWESFGHVAVATLSLTIACDCPPRDRVTRRRYTRTINPYYRYYA